MTRFIYKPPPPVVLVAAGKGECCEGHIGTQITEYTSPAGKHTIWTCPSCHRIVRQDEPGCFEWTAPIPVMPKGQEGVATPNGRQWKMPNVDAIKRPRPEVSASDDRKGWHFWR